ncbi:hypothetical protein [Cellulomonas sp.]|nr:hypothetical protein [Cellulomonas sp.]MBO9553936.1 hypothetical protein [Cellulomonas sp.]
MTESTGSDLPPAPTPDTWSAAEAADWDPNDETTEQPADKGDAEPPA